MFYEKLDIELKEKIQSLLKESQNCNQQYFEKKSKWREHNDAWDKAREDYYQSPEYKNSPKEFSKTKEGKAWKKKNDELLKQACEQSEKSTQLTKECHDLICEGYEKLVADSGLSKEDFRREDLLADYREATDCFDVYKESGYIFPDGRMACIHNFEKFNATKYFAPGECNTNRALMAEGNVEWHDGVLSLELDHEITDEQREVIKDIVHIAKHQSGLDDKHVMTVAVVCGSGYYDKSTDFTKKTLSCDKVLNEIERMKDKTIEELNASPYVHKKRERRGLER